MPKVIQDVAEVHYGKRQNGVADKYGPFPIIGAGGFLGYARTPLFSGPAIVVGRKGTLDNPIYVPTDFWAVDTTYAVIPKVHVHPKWLYFTLKKARLELLNEATGVPSLDRERLFRVPVQNIDYKEQSYISHVLDTIDEFIAQAETLIAKLKQVRAGVLNDLLCYGLDEHGQLRDPVAHPEQFKDSPLGLIPKEWEPGTLGDRVLIRSGFAFRSSAFVQKGVPLIRISNITINGVDLAECAMMPADYLIPFEAFSLKKNDLIIAMSGATVGKVALVKETNLPALMNQRVGRFSWRPYSSGWDSTFLYALSQSYRFQTFVSMESMGGAQPNVSGQEIEAFKIAWPDEAEQHRIAYYILSLDLALASAHEELRKFLSLKSGLQDDLLTGRVRIPETIMEEAERG